MANPFIGGLWVNYDHFFIYTPFGNSPTGQTGRRIAQTMQTYAKVFLLGVSLILFPVYGVISPNPNFYGMNRRNVK